MDVLIWDGISMSNKYAFDTVDRLFKGLCRNNKPFGGKDIIVSGDFRLHYQFCAMVAELK